MEYNNIKCIFIFFQYQNECPANKNGRDGVEDIILINVVFFFSFLFFVVEDYNLTFVVVGVVIHKMHVPPNNNNIFSSSTKTANTT